MRQINNFLDKQTHQYLRELCDDAHFNAKNDVNRSGLRPNAEVCLDFAGFDTFWSWASGLLLDTGNLDLPEAMTEKKWRHIELTRMRDGSYFATHNDAPAHNPYAPCFTFLYFIGDRKTFTGGEHFHFVDDSPLVMPLADNTLLMYNGSDLHGVLPIEGVRANRLTINGYFSP
jgi:hypothetical protein